MARESSGEREELIFDERTKVFLGEREIGTEDGEDRKKGDLPGTFAVMERTVVDKAGVRP